MIQAMQQQEKNFFNTPELSHRYELILHLLEYSNHLILVEGEKDIGKTSLFEHMVAQDESGLVIRKVTAHAHMSEQDLLGSLINDPSEPETNDAELVIEDYMQWLKRCSNKQQIPALLIDDADLLADELLEFVLRLISISEDTLSLHTCLFCEASFLSILKDRLQQESDSFSQHIIEMPHFSEQQTAQYINHIYPDTVTGTDAIDQKTVKQMHRISHGLPGRINALAEQYFNDPAGEEETSAASVAEPTSKTGFLQANRSYLIVGLLLLFLSVTVAYLLNSTEQVQETQTIKLDLPVQKTNDDIIMTSPMVERPVTEAMPLSEPEPPAIEDLSPPVIPQLAEDIKSGDNVIVLIDEQTEESTVTEADAETETEMENAISAVETEETTELEVAAVEAPAVAAPATVTEDADDKEQTKDLNWLLQQDPDSYVLQLIGAYEQETIDFYLKSFNDEQQQIISFSTTNNGKPWHVLVYGLFPNRQQAVIAIEALPARAKKMAPWPRTVKSIRALVSE